MNKKISRSLQPLIPEELRGNDDFIDQNILSFLEKKDITAISEVNRALNYNFQIYWKERVKLFFDRPLFRGGFTTPRVLMQEIMKKSLSFFHFDNILTSTLRAAESSCVISFIFIGLFDERVISTPNNAYFDGSKPELFPQFFNQNHKDKFDTYVRYTQMFSNDQWVYILNYMKYLCLKTQGPQLLKKSNLFYDDPEKRYDDYEETLEWKYTELYSNLIAEIPQSISSSSSSSVGGALNGGKTYFSCDK